MKEGNPKIRKRIWGIHPDEVEKQINRSRSNHRQEMDQLRKKIEEAQRKQLELQKKLNAIHESQGEGEIGKPELLEFSLNHARKMEGFMEQYVEQEMTLLREEAKHKLVSLENEIKALQKDNENARQLLQIFLQHFYQFVENMNNKELASDWLGKVQGLFELHNGKILAAVGHEPILPQEPDDKELIGRDFWSDTDWYMRIDTDTQTPRGEPVLVAIEEVEWFEEPKSKSVHKPQSEGNSRSAGSKNELDQISKRYIVGKLAGEDIYDSHGKLVISKNAMITDEVVEKANLEGMLAELIVNMKIPGLGD